MKKLCTVLLTVGFVAWSAAITSAADPATKGEAAEHAPDNTGRNVRDRGDTVTSGDQSETEADRTLTQKIRKAVVADDSLSMTAHNVKIITVDGVVTLRGPVDSPKEKATVAAKAENVPGVKRVDNQIEVTQR